MTMSRATRVAVAATVLFSVFAIAQDQEKKIQRSDLPPAVEKAVVKREQGGNDTRFLAGEGERADLLRS